MDLIAIQITENQFALLLLIAPLQSINQSVNQSINHSIFCQVFCVFPIFYSDYNWISRGWYAQRLFQVLFNLFGKYSVNDFIINFKNRLILANKAISNGLACSVLFFLARQGCFQDAEKLTTRQFSELHEKPTNGYLWSPADVLRKSPIIFYYQQEPVGSAQQSMICSSNQQDSLKLLDNNGRIPAIRIECYKFLEYSFNRISSISQGRMSWQIIYEEVDDRLSGAGRLAWHILFLSRLYYTWTKIMDCGRMQITRLKEQGCRCRCTIKFLLG